MSSLDAADQFYTDKEITATFGDAYDHPQIHEGYQDDDMHNEQPFRFVKNWCLRSSSSSSGNNNPLALPDGTFTGKKYTNAYLEGLVVPPKCNSHLYDPIKIRLVLTATDYVSVDRSKTYRGFWIIMASSGGNCYWLHEPDEIIHPGAQKSQADVHFDHIAWLAVLSNLMDAVFTLHGGSAWANESVNDVYERLKTPANNDQPPFDKVLLIQYKKEIYPHLLHSQIYLTKECKFMRSLKNSKPPKAAKDRKNQTQIKESTNAALERSQQHPWGEPKNSVIIKDDEIASLSLLVDDDDGTNVVDTDGDNGHGHVDSVLGREKNEIKLDNSAKKKKRKIKSLETSSAETGEAAAGATSGKPTSKRQKTTMDNSQKQKSSKEQTAGELIPSKSKKRTSSLEEEQDEKKNEDHDYNSSTKSSHKQSKHPTAAPARLEPNPPLSVRDNLLEAFETCNGFLVPKPSTVDVDASSWKCVQAHQFCVKDEASAKSLLNIASKWDVKEKPESCLLVVEAFRLSCIKGNTKVMKPLFSPKENASMLFNGWRICAMENLKERDSIKATVPELFLLTSIISLIADCNCIDSEKRLRKLKERGVDWQDIVDQVIKFIKEIGCRSKKLREACEVARKRIDDIKAVSSITAGDASTVGAVTEKTGQPSSGTALDQQATTATRTVTTKKNEQDGGTVSTDRQQQVAMTRVESVDTEVKDESIVKEDTKSAILKNSEEDEKAKRQKEADEQRRQRILQLYSAQATKSVPTEEDPTPTPSLEEAKIPLTTSRREIQPWKPKVHLPWNETTFMPRRYRYCTAHDVSSGITPSVLRPQDPVARHSFHPTANGQTRYASSGGDGMSSGRHNAGRHSYIK